MITLHVTFNPQHLRAMGTALIAWSGGWWNVDRDSAAHWRKLGDDLIAISERVVPATEGPSAVRLKLHEQQVITDALGRAPDLDPGRVIRDALWIAADRAVQDADLEEAARVSSGNTMAKQEWTKGGDR